MYKYGFSIFLIFLIFNLNAQPLPGKVILRGSSALTGQFFTTNSTIGDFSTEVKTSQFNFQPSIGRYVSHFIFLGIYTGYNYQKEKEYFKDSKDNRFNKSTSLALGPYIRCYFSDFKFAPFLHGNIGYSSQKIEQQADMNSDIYSFKMKGVNYGLGLGIEYFIERKYSFEFLFIYNGTSVRGDATSSDYFDNTSVSLSQKNKGFGFRIGASIFLN